MRESFLRKEQAIMIAWKILKGAITLSIIWVICLAASPVFLGIIAARYVQDFLAAKKKLVDEPKSLSYVPASRDNEIHSYN